MMKNPAADAARHFRLSGTPHSIEPYGCGHINRTYLMVTDSGHRYILQRISDAFDAKKLMSNTEAVTGFLLEKTADPREVLRLIPTTEGKSYYEDDTGSYRVFDFVENSICLQEPECVEDFYQSAVAFGNFLQMMADFQPERLCEAIPDFHNTPNRYRLFHEALKTDALGRAKSCQKEIRFALAREKEAGILQTLREKGELPLRVTHNDTKLNNVLLDQDTRKAVCIIDMDTVMPGLSLYDFGDSIRFGAATAAEDEQDLEKMTIDLEMFQAFTRGFTESCPDLTDREIELFPMGAKIMTLECGVRFLTDYLEGDHYFKVHKENHNLLRTRTQFKLVDEMEKHWDEMTEIVKKCRDL